MQIAENPKPIPGNIREKMEQFRSKLLGAGLLEPTKLTSSVWNWKFYKPMTDLTAFVLNLQGREHWIEVTFGYASTAFTRMIGDENALAELGIFSEDITIREQFILCDESEEEVAAGQIRQMYERYLHTEKEELLALAKAKRKEFIGQIALRLKPLGFKKKANSWKRELENGYYLIFNAQKSMYSDEYYFNIFIGTGTNNYGDCFYTRIAPGNRFPMDWQALTADEFSAFLDQTLVPALENFIYTPLSELGARPSIWKACSCKRNKCSPCWVQKNLWEAKGIP